MVYYACCRTTAVDDASSAANPKDSVEKGGQPDLGEMGPKDLLASLVS